MLTSDRMFLLALADALERECAELPADVPEGSATVTISKTLCKDIIAAVRRDQLSG